MKRFHENNLVCALLLLSSLFGTRFWFLPSFHHQQVGNRLEIVLFWYFKIFLPSFCIVEKLTPYRNILFKVEKKEQQNA